MTPITDDQIAALVEAAGKATPGPWQRNGARHKMREGEDCLSVGSDTMQLAFFPIGRDHAGAFKDAGFVALANPITIRALASRVQSAEAKAASDAAVIAGLRVALEQVREAGAAFSDAFLDGLEVDATSELEAHDDWLIENPEQPDDGPASIGVSPGRLLKLVAVARTARGASV